MTRLRFVALVLLAGTRVALAQNQPAMPCGAPVYDNQLWFESKSFCVRTRAYIKPDGGHRLKAAIDGSRYCDDAEKQFDMITNCHFSGTVRCQKKTKAFVITAQFFNCKGLFGRKYLTLRRKPLADALEPPGISSAAGAFVSP